MPVELATAYVSLVPSAKGIATGIQKELGGPLSTAGAQAGESTAKRFGASFKGGLATVGKVAGVGLLAGVTGAVAGVGALAKIGDSFDSAFDSIRTGTGQTGLGLAVLQNDFKKTFAAAPVSMEDTATAISQLNTRLGLAGNPLQSLSVQMLNLSRITETDLGTNIESVSKLFTNFGVSAQQQGGKLDLLFRASQKTGISVAELAAGMTSVGPVARQVGLSFDQTAALLATLNKAGVDAGAVMPALSKSIAAAAKDGKSAQDVFTGTFDAIRKAPDATSAAGAAIEVFGAKAGPKLAELIRSGALSYEDLLKTIQGGGDTINQAAADTNDWREKLKLLGNKTLVAIQPLAAKVFDGIGKVVEKVTPFIVTFATWLGDKLPKVFAVFGEAFSGGEVTTQGFLGVVGKVGYAIRGLIDAVKRNMPKVQQILGTVFEQAGNVIGWFQKNVLPGLIAGFQEVVAWVRRNWTTIQTVFKAVVTAIQVTVTFLVTQVLPRIVDAITIVVNAIRAAVDWVRRNWPTISAIFQTVAGAIQATITFLTTQVFPRIATAVQAVITAVQAVITWVQTNWPTISAIFQTVASAIQTIIETVLGIIQGLWEKYGSAIITYVQGFWETLRGIFDTAMSIIRGIIQTVTALIHGDWSGAWDAITRMVSGIWDGITGIVKGAIDGIKATLQIAWTTITTVATVAWNGLKTGISNIADGLVSYIGGIPGKLLGLAGQFASAALDLGGAIVRGIGNGLASIGSVITAPIKAAWNAVAHLWNSSVGNFSFSIPSWVPGVGGKGFDMPNLPTLARGAIVNRATLGIFGEAGPEVVLPLSDPRRALQLAQQSGLLDILGQALPMPSVAGGFSGGNQYAITVNVSPGADPARAGQAVVDAITAYERRNGSGWRN